MEKFNWKQELRETELFVKAWFQTCQPQDCLKLPCQLLYCRENRFELLPYLDLSRKDEICAIKCGKLSYALRHEELMDTYELRAKEHMLGKAFLFKTIPHWHQLVEAGVLYKDFTITVGVLQRFGIKAETWRPGGYLTTTPLLEERALGYDIKARKVCSFGLTESCNVRLAYCIF